MTIRSAILGIWIFSGLTFASRATSQNIRNVYINLNLKNASVVETLKAIERKTDFVFFYEDQLVSNLREKITIEAQNKSVAFVLGKISRKARLSFLQKNNTIAVKRVAIPPPPEKKPEEKPQERPVEGTVKDEQGTPLPGVNIVIQERAKGTTTDFDGNYAINVQEGDILTFSYVGFISQEIPANGKDRVDVVLKEDAQELDEVVITGYSSQEKKSLTGSIATVTSDDLENVHGGATVSSGLAGKIPGVTFRMSDGRPGASASVQIRNMGTPLFIIDGVPQDEGQFNNLAPNDVASITVLKDASAAIYGVRAANGVVVVTTKRGKKGSRNTVNINAYTGWQNWSRFPEPVNDSYKWMLMKAEADVNQYGETAITPEELEKYRIGTEEGYKSFNWKDFIIKKNAPLTSINISTSGGSDRINYYLSATKLKQEAVLGKEFRFERTNIQSSIDANISKRLRVGSQINGRIEVRDRPGIPGADDYWLPRFAILRNRPFERPYANDNPEYLNDIGHNETNWALHNKKIGGYSLDTWRVIQANFTGEYDIPYIDGLTLKGMYSYYLADRVLDGHEYTYEAYTYRPDTDTYEVTGGSTNPWRERENKKVFRQLYQGQLHYKNSFGDHNIESFFVIERKEDRETRQWVHSVPDNNDLPLIYFKDMDTFDDSDNEEARIGYIGRISYNWKHRYYLELSGRRDASWMFAPGKRTGFFPSVSGGWRITDEKFMQNLLGENTVLNDLKFRASYGVLGDDNRDVTGLGAYDYLSGYNYNTSQVILDGDVVVGSRNRGLPITNFTWFKSKITNIGADFYMFDSKLNGSFEYFYRKRTGLRGRKYDILIPSEVGYSLPDENVNSDARYGIEGALSYSGNFGELTFTVSGNASVSRSKFLDSYKPRYRNSLQEYRARREGRYEHIFWGLIADGQFQSQEEIDNYPVNIDGRGNATLLPGDIIYKDLNKDGYITGDDERPIGYTSFNPNINYGFSLRMAYKGFDLTADFSGASGYSWSQQWETRTPFQNEGALNKIFLDRWHRADPFDANSEWIPGKYPPLRFNDGGQSSYRNSTYWLHNVTYFRARTLELGYSLPKELLEKVGIQKFRVYVNGYNLFSIDNLSDFGIDPEIKESNGLEYPPNKFVNLGVNISL
ncbi:TonB-dependent receptor [Sinomicrobium sp. FJxs]|uniref:TonB-dependent receptor n=2 Tax=Sinomicrobium weinanense TaxID=2842200 RepID=A0A926JTW5_9FLAO|nr:TonB-dependent receptor [Sinomicrobium weinanense]MBU3124802.1 TonB-dependent receptor [Sinomicrobium weinanense]